MASESDHSVKNPKNDEASASKSFLEKSRPQLKRLEGIRLEKLRVFELRKKMAKPIAFIMTPVLGLIDFMLLMLQRGSDDPAAGLTIVGLGALWGWVTNPKRQYTRAYKTVILPDIARLFGDFKYDVKGKIPMDAMKPSKIVPSHTSYHSEDYFSGDYKGVGINFSEINLTKKSGDSTITVFKGLAVLLTHGTRKFYGHTIMTKDLGKLGEWSKTKSSKLERANLVDPEFEKIFDVFTNDQVEARYLIDPLIIENLKALYSEYNGDKMLAAFYDDHFLILIGSNTNHFEPASIEVPATNEAALLSMKREIEQILSIVERLSLYDSKARRKAESGSS